MNKERRKKLAEVVEKIEVVKAEITELMEAEEAAFNNCPGSMQESERGQAMEGNVDILQEAVDTLDELDNALNQIVGGE